MRVMRLSMESHPAEDGLMEYNDNIKDLNGIHFAYIKL